MYDHPQRLLSESSLFYQTLSVGSTEVESLQNFKEWCDSLALKYSGDHCLVTDCGGNRIYGLYHQMKEGEHDNFEGKLSEFVTWAAHLLIINRSAWRTTSKRL